MSKKGSGPFLTREASDKPLISVVTVCFNSEEFIKQCIQSVLSQGFDSYEYVVIDGGSTDGTVDIIKKHQDRLAYWHSKPDRGLAHAFNLGIEHSRGRWLLFLNSDDFFVSSSVLSDISGKLLEHSVADVVFGQIEVVSRNAHPKKVRGPYGEVFKWHEFLRQDTIPHQAAFTNRDYFTKVGMFDESFRVAVDYEHFLRGGEYLKAVCVQGLISGMREGGMGKRLLRQSLKEWRIAQVDSGGRSVINAKLGYYYFLLKTTVRDLLFQKKSVKS